MDSLKRIIVFGLFSLSSSLFGDNFTWSITLENGETVDCEWYKGRVESNDFFRDIVGELYVEAFVPVYEKNIEKQQTRRDEFLSDWKEYVDTWTGDFVKEWNDDFHVKCVLAKNDGKLVAVMIFSDEIEKGFDHTFYDGDGNEMHNFGFHRKVPLLSADEKYLDWLFVHPDYQEKGLAWILGLGIVKICPEVKHVVACIDAYNSHSHEVAFHLGGERVVYPQDEIEYDLEKTYFVQWDIKKLQRLYDNNKKSTEKNTN